MLEWASMKEDSLFLLIRIDTVCDNQMNDFIYISDEITIPPTFLPNGAYKLVLKTCSFEQYKLSIVHRITPNSWKAIIE